MIVNNINSYKYLLKLLDAMPRKQRNREMIVFSYGYPISPRKGGPYTFSKESYRGKQRRTILLRLYDLYDIPQKSA